MAEISKRGAGATASAWSGKTLATQRDQIQAEIETLKAELRRQLEKMKEGGGRSGGNASTAQLTQNTMRRSA